MSYFGYEKFEAARRRAEKLEKGTSNENKIEVEHVGDLYNILKRSVNGKVNKIVGIGFTLDEAKEWINRKTCKAKEHQDTVVFYDIVAQKNRLGLNPFWNARPIVTGDGI